MKFYEKQILAAVCIPISFADHFEIIFDPFKGRQSKLHIACEVKAQPV